MKPTRPLLLMIVKAVAEGAVTEGTVLLAKKAIADENAEPMEKAPIASQEHHAKVRRAEEREEEKVSREVLEAVIQRSMLDHRGQVRCEACHKHAVLASLHPHHLSMGSGHREDRVDWVMLLCDDCHTLDPMSAHRSPALFARMIVIPWAKAHSYTDLPKRKEYLAL